MTPRLQASPALIEMLAQSGELERILDGRGLDFSGNQPTHTPPPPGPSIRELMAADPVDWHQELAERAAAERAAAERERTKIIEAELERIAAAEDTEAFPAKKRR
jgi:hypothetical protein